MKIGEAARRSGLPAKTIRYYEEIGLVVASRGDNGYRQYSERDIQKLMFIARARALGFDVEDCRSLLSLYDDDARASADVRLLATDHLARIRVKLDQLEGLREVLSTLVSACSGDRRPDCPILADIAGQDRGPKAG